MRPREPKQNGIPTTVNVHDLSLDTTLPLFLLATTNQESYLSQQYHVQDHHPDHDQTPFITTLRTRKDVTTTTPFESVSIPTTKPPMNQNKSTHVHLFWTSNNPRPRPTNKLPCTPFCIEQNEDSKKKYSRTCDLVFRVLYVVLFFVRGNVSCGGKSGRKRVGVEWKQVVADNMEISSDLVHLNLFQDCVMGQVYLTFNISKPTSYVILL